MEIQREQRRKAREGPQRESRFKSVTASWQGTLESFACAKAYVEDDNKCKVNLGQGSYLTEHGVVWTLPQVRRAEVELAEDPGHEYLPSLGLSSFSKRAVELTLGEGSPVLKRAFTVQTLSATGALRLAAEFLSSVLAFRVFYTSSPTWPNFKLIFRQAGFTVEKRYRYWDPERRCLDLPGLLEDLRNALPHSAVIIQPCSHNPTGLDPTEEQWRQIARVIHNRNLFPIFDLAYQGLASGDLDKDAWPIRYFASLGFEAIICQGFSKNFCLMGERIGTMTVVVNNPATLPAIKSHLNDIIRSLYLTPPAHGAKVIGMILNNKEYRVEWKNSLMQMRNRMEEMRGALMKKLQLQNTPGKWEHIGKQQGMYCYSGLTQEQAKVLVFKYHIYLLKSGRINICGLNYSNLDYVVQAFHSVITKSHFPDQREFRRTTTPRSEVTEEHLKVQPDTPKFQWASPRETSASTQRRKWNPRNLFV